MRLIGDHRDNKTRLRDLAAGYARALLKKSRPLPSEGAVRPSREGAGDPKRDAGDPQERAQGRPGARCTRGLACKGNKKSAHEHTGSAEAVRPSLRNGFTAYSVLSLAIGFFVTIISEKLASQRLDASIGASGPHDFAVRLTRCSSIAHRRPPHPAPRP